MTKAKRTQKKVAKMAAGVSKEQELIEKAIQADTTPVKRTIILPEGVTGVQLKRKVYPQTSAKAAELNPALKPKVDSAKESAKEGTVVKTGIVAKAAAAKAEKDGKTEKKAKAVGGKYVHNITSMEKLGDWCLAQKLTDEETLAVFVEAYKTLKNETDLKFIKPRVVIYQNIARKRAAKIAEALTKAEAAVVKEKKTLKVDK